MSSPSEIVLSTFKLDDSNFSATPLAKYFPLNLTVFNERRTDFYIVPVRYNHYPIKNDIVAGLATKRF
tara:strand:+ start:25485 stop:25688 length:204 start_codon:yes stop_codon:yes gene_type:complete